MRPIRNNINVSIKLAVAFLVVAGGLLWFSPLLQAKTFSQSAYFVTHLNKPIGIRLLAFSDQSADLKFEIVDPPKHGTLKGQPPDLVYHPEPDFNGIDRFIFHATDDSGEGSHATVRITVGTGGVYHAEDLGESSIQLVVRKDKAFSFYGVMVDPEERPYLDVKEFLQQGLELFPNCKPAQVFCEVQIHAIRKSFRLDGKKMKMETGEGDAVAIAPGALLVKDGVLWLRYDQWGHWLPLKVNWNLEEYRLGMVPQFPLVSDLFKQKKKLRKSSQLEREKVLEVEKMPPLEPSSDFDTEFRYKIGQQRSLHTQQYNQDFNFDLNSDIYQGTLQFSGTISQNVQPDNDYQSNSHSWNYRRIGQPVFELIELGHIFLESGRLFPSKGLTSGLLMQRKLQVQGSGRQVVTGRALPGTEIELYRNGFLIQNLLVGSEGSYEFNQILASGGEVIRLVFLFPDGSTKSESKFVAEDDGSILNIGDWDYQMAHGQTNEGDLSKLSMSYGIVDNLSAGISSYNYELTGDQYRLQGIYLAYRPFFGLNLLYETLGSMTEANSLWMADVTYFDPHFFQLRTLYQNPSGSLFQLQSGDEKTARLNQINYHFSQNDWLLLVDAGEGDDKDSVRVNLRNHIDSRWTFLTEPEVFKEVGQEMKSMGKVGVEYATESHSFSAGRNWLLGESDLSAQYRYYGKKEVPYDFSLGLRRSDGGEFDLLASIQYRPFDKLSTGARIQGGQRFINAYYSDILSTSNVPENWEHYAMGNLKGRIILPDTDKESLGSLEGIVVKAGSQKGITDEKGNYKITGLPVHQKLKVEIDPGSLDIGFTPAEEYIVTRFRPGTTLRYDPKLQRTTGLDGFLVWDARPQKDLIIEAYSIPNMKLFAQSPVEEDGFFIFEGLKPGSYIVKIKDIPSPANPLVITVPPGEIWISDVTVQWEE